MDERVGKNSTESKRAPVGHSLLSAVQQSWGHTRAGTGGRDRMNRKRERERN